MSAQSGLRCPYCDHPFDLSWRRYLLATRRRHLCSACGEKFKIKLNFAFNLVTFVVGVAAPVPAAILIAYGAPDFPDLALFKLWLIIDSTSLRFALALWFVGCLMSFWWLDKYFQRKYGALHKIT